MRYPPWYVRCQGRRARELKWGVSLPPISESPSSDPIAWVAPPLPRSAGVRSKIYRHRSNRGERSTPTQRGRGCYVRSERSPHAQHAPQSDGGWRRRRRRRRRRRPQRRRCLVSASGGYGGGVGGQAAAAAAGAA
jgi:hypothetical protein